jgi:Amt family ammonium transporter
MSTSLSRPCWVKGSAVLGVALLLPLRAAFGQDVAHASGLNSGDVAWVLTSSAIVLMMTIPGLSLFYGGLVRSKNVLSILMQCFVTAALVSVTWVLWGYSLAFGPDQGGLVGDLSLFALRGVSFEAGPDENIPAQAFMVFQLMFAVITPALIVGAIAERMKFAAFLLFIVAWSTLVYSPLAHWVWGKGGWLAARGALDFAGGTVVHISSGTSALVAAAMIGARRGHGREPMAPHHVPFVLVGAALLWVGWFGFNAGSALAANHIATVAFVNTNTATAAAVLGWMFSEWIGKGVPTAVGAATGAVAGLVAITPAAGFVEPWAALIIGAFAGLLCYKACNWKTQIGYDDALDVVGVHGVGGTWGAVATGLFASPALSDGGLFTGNPGQLLIQIEAVAATYGLCLVGTFLVLGIVNSVVGLRVSGEQEEVGLDLALHAERAYATASTASLLGEPSPRPVRAPATRVPASAPQEPTPAAPASSRHPPVARPMQREAPLAASSLRPSSPRALPPAPARSDSLSTNAAGGHFRVVVEGIEPHVFSRWWRGLCAQSNTAAPEAFRDIYPNVITFEGNTLGFKGGDPKTTRARLDELLQIYGMHFSRLTIEPG